MPETATIDPESKYAKKGHDQQRPPRLEAEAAPPPLLQESGDESDSEGQLFRAPSPPDEEEDTSRPASERIRASLPSLLEQLHGMVAEAMEEVIQRHGGIPKPDEETRKKVRGVAQEKARRELCSRLQDGIVMATALENEAVKAATYIDMGLTRSTPVSSQPSSRHASEIAKRFASSGRKETLAACVKVGTSAGHEALKGRVKFEPDVGMSGGDVGAARKEDQNVVALERYETDIRDVDSWGNNDNTGTDTGAGSNERGHQNAVNTGEGLQKEISEGSYSAMKDAGDWVANNLQKDFGNLGPLGRAVGIRGFSANREGLDLTVAQFPVIKPYPPLAKVAFPFPLFPGVGVTLELLLIASLGINGGLSVRWAAPDTDQLLSSVTGKREQLSKLAAALKKGPEAKQRQELELKQRVAEDELKKAEEKLDKAARRYAITAKLGAAGRFGGEMFVGAFGGLPIANVGAGLAADLTTTGRATASLTGAFNVSGDKGFQAPELTGMFDMLAKVSASLSGKMKYQVALLSGDLIAIELAGRDLGIAELGGKLVWGEGGFSGEQTKGQFRPVNIPSASKKLVKASDWAKEWGLKVGDAVGSLKEDAEEVGNIKSRGGELVSKSNRLSRLSGRDASGLSAEEKEEFKTLYGEIESGAESLDPKVNGKGAEKLLRKVGRDTDRLQDRGFHALSWKGIIENVVRGRFEGLLDHYDRTLQRYGRRQVDYTQKLESSLKPKIEATENEKKKVDKSRDDHTRLVEVGKRHPGFAEYFEKREAASDAHDRFLRLWSTAQGLRKAHLRQVDRELDEVGTLDPSERKGRKETLKKRKKGLKSGFQDPIFDDLRVQIEKAERDWYDAKKAFESVKVDDKKLLGTTLEHEKKVQALDKKARDLDQKATLFKIMLIDADNEIDQIVQSMGKNRRDKQELDSVSKEANQVWRAIQEGKDIVEYAEDVLEEADRLMREIVAEEE